MLFRHVSENESCAHLCLADYKARTLCSLGWTDLATLPRNNTNSICAVAVLLLLFFMTNLLVATPVILLAVDRAVQFFLAPTAALQLVAQGTDTTRGTTDSRVAKKLDKGNQQLVHLLADRLKSAAFERVFWRSEGEA
jgi:hypothetical protein